MAEDVYDVRREALVMETRTFFEPALATLSPEDKAWLSAAVQSEPQKAAKISYERSHTGFTREITVTVADVARLYRERGAAQPH